MGSGGPCGLQNRWSRCFHRDGGFDSLALPPLFLLLPRFSDAPIRLSFDKMFASDLSGRARAFQSMVGGGMPVDKAAALAGLIDPSE